MTKTPKPTKPRPLTRREMTDLINSTVRAGGYVRWHFGWNEHYGHSFYKVERAWSDARKFRVLTAAGWKTCHWHEWFEINGVIWRGGLVDREATGYFRDMAKRGGQGLNVASEIEDAPHEVTGLRLW
jgi:hypothetical protein